MKRSLCFHNVLFVLAFFFLSEPVWATITPEDSAAIAESVDGADSNYSYRIYSYDMEIDDNGNIHVVYSRPYGSSQSSLAQVVYAKKTANSSSWTKVTLATEGLRASRSTELEVSSDSIVHICYIGGDENLYYVQVDSSGNVGSAIEVAEGAWHTRMQLDANERPIFVREGQNWTGVNDSNPYKLTLLTTTDNTTWSKSFLDLDLAEDGKYRLADFQLKNGIYHITYGDYGGKSAANATTTDYHNLHYATSINGTTWTCTTLDSTGTLYEQEFWTSLALDADKPLVGFYKYASYNNQENTGTSAVFYRWNGSSWTNKIITNTTYANSREGMGIGLVVNDSLDYLVAWDFSPDSPQQDGFSGTYGNTALSRNGNDAAWSGKVQIDAFSMEGQAVLRIKNGTLYMLYLGDYHDSKLYFRQFSMSYIDEILPYQVSGGGSSAGLGKALPGALEILLLKKDI